MFNFSALPSPPQKISYDVTDTSTICLKWSTENVPGAPAQKYEVLYSLNKSESLSTWKKKDIEGGESLEAAVSFILLLFIYYIDSDK